MEEYKKINKILSVIYIVFNFIFFVFIIQSFFKSSNISTKSLKMRLYLLIIIDTIIYLHFLIDLKIFENLYYEIFMVGIYSCQVYLFISIYTKLIVLIKIKKLKEMDKTLPTYQISLISFILILPFHKIYDSEPIIIIFIQSSLSVIAVYLLYKQFIRPIEIILSNLNKKNKNKNKIYIVKNLKFLLNLSFCFIFGKIIINILIISFTDKKIQDFLELPLNLIIYLKYFVYTLFYLVIGQLEEILMNKRINDDAYDKLKYQNDNN